MTMSEAEPSPKTVDYARLRNRFGLGFLISTSLFVLLSVCALTFASLNMSPAMTPTRRPERTPTPIRTQIPSTAIPITPADTPPTPEDTEPPPTATPTFPVTSAGGSLDTLTLAAAIVGIGGTCLTSMTTLAGFAVTTVLSLRQERRHARVSDLERQLQEVALEKKKLELERMKLQKQDPPGDGDKQDSR
jgi:hypothetical protein